MTFQIDKPANLIDLGVGQPDPELLPSGLFQSTSINTSHLGYGKEAGDERFRQTLSDWLSKEYGQPVLPEQLLVSCGSSNALNMICQQFARPGATVLVEDPTYFIALKLIAEHGLKTVAIPMDEDGIQLDALEAAIAEHQPAFIYSIPSFQNPTGISQPDERRRALVQLAKQHQCPVVADEVYQSLYFEQRPPPPLACYDPQAPVLSIGSFSKILAPGLRLGWIQASGPLRQQLLSSALLKSGGGLAPVTSALVEPLIARGELDEHLSGLRKTLQTRRDCLHHALEKHLADRLQVNKPQGGYFLWATRTDGSDTTRALAAAKQARVAYLGGALCGTDHRFAASMRVCFAWYGERDLETACERLARVF